MHHRMVHRNFQAKIVESGKFYSRYEAIFFQGLSDSRERKEDHLAEIKIIAYATQLIIIERMKSFFGGAFIIEI